MKEVLKKIAKPFCQIIALMPSRLPSGVTEFEKFYHSILWLYGFPDDKTYKHAIASSIMHLSPLTIRKSKSFFGKTVKKAQVNQIAYNVLDEIRKQDALEQKKLSEQAQPN